MSTGQADETAKVWVTGEKARDLGLLSAHDVCGFFLLDPRKNENVRPGIDRCNPQCLIQTGRLARYPDIMSFGPPLSRTDHSAADYWCLKVFGQMIANQFEKSIFELVRGKRAHAFFRCQFRCCGTRSIDQPDTESGCAPIHRYPLHT